ncbi:MAG: hypothetical protein Q7S03_03130 [bacterium]|nr:hypothetical protein [bacterium]
MFFKGLKVALGSRFYAIVVFEADQVVLQAKDGSRMEISRRTFDGIEPEPHGFNIVCIDCGEVSFVSEESPLGVRALARFQKGYIDALPVTSEECPKCLEFHKRHIGEPEDFLTLSLC